MARENPERRGARVVYPSSVQDAISRGWTYQQLADSYIFGDSYIKFDEQNNIIETGIILPNGRFQKTN